MDRDYLMQELTYLETSLGRLDEHIRIQRKLISEFEAAGRDWLLIEARALLTRFEELQKENGERRYELLKELESLDRA
jgi:hypothetical protein